MIRATIRAMLKTRRRLHVDGRPRAWEIILDDRVPRYFWLAVWFDALDGGDAVVLRVTEQSLAETEDLVAGELVDGAGVEPAGPVDLVEYLALCVER